MPRPGLSTTQQYQQTHPAVHGGIIGALVVLVLVLLIGGGAFLFISNRNSADANATANCIGSNTGSIGGYEYANGGINANCNELQDRNANVHTDVTTECHANFNTDQYADRYCDDSSPTDPGRSRNKRRPTAPDCRSGFRNDRANGGNCACYDHL